MHLAAFGGSGPDSFIKGCGGSTAGNTDTLRDRAHAGLRPAPYDIVDVNVIGIYCLPGAVKVDYGCIAL